MSDGPFELQQEMLTLLRRTRPSPYYLGLLERGSGGPDFPPALAEGGRAGTPILRLRGRLAGMGPGSAQLVRVGGGRVGGWGGRHVCSLVGVQRVARGRRGRPLPPRPGQGES